MDRHARVCGKVSGEGFSLGGLWFSNDTLVHVTFLIVAVALLVRDVLWLRVLTMLAYSLEILRIELVGELTLNSWLGWYTAFVVINAGHAGWLIYERRLVRLTPDERALAAVAFPALDRATLKRLLRAGQWRRLAPGETLTRAGTRPEVVGVIRSGQIDVWRHGRVSVSLPPGSFVAEMSFLTGAPASVDTVAAGPVELFVWNQAALKRHFQRHPVIQLAFYAAIGPDLVMKITQGDSRTVPPSGASPVANAAEIGDGRNGSGATGSMAASGPDTGALDGTR